MPIRHVQIYYTRITMMENKMHWLPLLFLVVLASCISKERQNEQPASAKQIIIFETDLGNDIDDALALDMLYKYLRCR